MNRFTIRDLENLTGIKAHTLRIWEKRYSLLKPKRSGTNIRYYTNEDLKAILNISLLNKYGYRISRIAKMGQAEINKEILSLVPGARQDKVINTMIRQMIDLDMDAFETGVDGFIIKSGIEKAIKEIIFPFLERIGVLWQTGNISPAQEHLVSNIIRQKLIVGINNVRTSLKTGKSFLLFLPEGEYHELGLLFVYYILKSRGAKVIYIGANIPLKEAQVISDSLKPDYLYIHLTSISANFNFDRFLTGLSRRMGSIQTIISGHMTTTYRKRIPANIHFKKSLSEVLKFISSI